MSYYAKHSGYIQTKPLTGESLTQLIKTVTPPEKILNTDISDPLLALKMERPFGTAWGINYCKRIETDDNDTVRIFVSVRGYDDYDEQKTIEFLASISPYVESGEIKYTGEDGSLWRHIFTDDGFEEEQGKIVYEKKGKLE